MFFRRGETVKKLTGKGPAALNTTPKRVKEKKLFIRKDAQKRKIFQKHQERLTKNGGKGSVQCTENKGKGSQ